MYIKGIMTTAYEIAKPQTGKNIKISIASMLFDAYKKFNRDSMTLDSLTFSNSIQAGTIAGSHNT